MFKPYLTVMVGGQSSATTSLGRKHILKKVGALENSSRGVWSITKQGEQLTVDDVRSIPARVRKQVVKDKLTKDVAPALENLATGLDKEDIEETDPHWKDQLLDILRSDFRGAMVGRSDKGLLITTGTFTPDAKQEATRDGAPAIDLIDGDQLCDLLKDLKLGIRVELVEKMTVESVFFGAL